MQSQSLNSDLIKIPKIDLNESSNRLIKRNSVTYRNELSANQINDTGNRNSRSLIQNAKRIDQD